jgi:hypothetical protein
MKVAITLSGQARLFAESIESWNNIAQKYKADIYIHTWDDKNAPILASQLQNTFNTNNISIDLPLSLNTRLYPNRHLPYINVYNSLSMWHSISRAYNQAMMANIDYDIVIRGRTDFFVKDLELVNTDGIVIPYDPDKFSLRFMFRGKEICGINDHFAYGHPTSMKGYVNTLNEIYSLYSDDMVDYCPENFLAASLMKQNIEVTFQKMEHKLIRG